jgi:hypothetical protein
MIEPADLQRAHAEMRAAYWERKDVAQVVAIATDAIGRGRGSTDPTVLAWVKVIAYDLASFTWPGWDEPGIRLTPADMAKGLEAARLDLELAIALERPDEKVSIAHWIVGAHLLAAGSKDEAVAAFGEAAAAAVRAGDPAQELLARGYAAIARADDAALATVKDGFAGIEDEAEYVAQLEVARRVFGG